MKQPSLFALLLLAAHGDAFVPSLSSHWHQKGCTCCTEPHPLLPRRQTRPPPRPRAAQHRTASILRAPSRRVGLASGKDDGASAEDGSSENPYADPDYPDLEFVDYSDPDYQVDQGTGDEFYDASNASTEEEIERMREERRRQNDEYQFQTYFAEILKNGDTFLGEWTVYKSSSFLSHIASDANGLPRLVKSSKPIKVKSRAYKVFDPEERIVHEEVLASENSDPYESWQQDLDVDRGFGSHDDLLLEEAPASDGTETDDADAAAVGKETLIAYWPDELQKIDFRGPQGIMCVGNAYTIATAVPLHEDQAPNEGPYKEYRAEVGIQSKVLRFRVKLNYAVVGNSADVTKARGSAPPPLLLKSLVVCREARELWPRPGRHKSVADRWSENGLFGKPGAPGGLYDPPPIDDVQAQRYMLLDLEGRATVLFPYQMDQSPEAFDGNGWVSSLDWTPDTMRFQVDRKVNGGKEILGLRTLELSEVQSKDADTYRPRDGGQNMRQ